MKNKPKKNILMNEKAMLSEAHDEIEQLKRLLKVRVQTNNPHCPSMLSLAPG